MKWQPITQEKFEHIIQQEIRGLSTCLRVDFQNTYNIKKIKCNRGPKNNEEEIFSIAQSTSHILIFDDVEDEFGIALKPVEINTISDWELFPDFESAVRYFFNKP